MFIVLRSDCYQERRRERPDETLATLSTMKEGANFYPDGIDNSGGILLNALMTGNN